MGEKMSVQIGITDSSQQKYKVYISDVLKKLPPDISKKICEECLVCLVGCNPADQFGFTKKDVITLNTNLMDKMYCEPQKLYVIAHEFAHHILSPPPPMERGMKEQHEKEADTLVEKWGFSLEKKTS